MDDARAKSWLITVLKITDKATSVTLLFMLVTGGVFGWYLLGEIRRLQAMNQALYTQLLDEQKAYVALALQCAKGEK